MVAYSGLVLRVYRRRVTVEVVTSIEWSRSGRLVLALNYDGQPRVSTLCCAFPSRRGCWWRVSHAADAIGTAAGVVAGGTVQWRC